MQGFVACLFRSWLREVHAGAEELANEHEPISTRAQWARVGSSVGAFEEILTMLPLSRAKRLSAFLASSPEFWRRKVIQR